jgi:hypothetical protein
MLIHGNHRPICACLCLILFSVPSTSLKAQDAGEEAQQHFAAAKQAEDSGNLQLRNI